MTDIITLNPKPPERRYKPLIQPLILSGEIVRDFKKISELKERTKNLVDRASKTVPRILWH